MALLTLSPLSGSPANIQIDELDIYRVTANGIGSIVVFSGPSAFLGDQQSVLVTESIYDIDTLSASLIMLTVGGSSVLLNANKIINVVANGSGSKITYTEFGVTNYVFASESETNVKNKVGVATNSTKNAVFGGIYSANPSTATAASIISGYVEFSFNAPANFWMPDLVDLQAAGMAGGSSISFIVYNSGSADVTLGSGANGLRNISNDKGFNGGLAGDAMVVQSIGMLNVAKFEIFVDVSNTFYTLSRVY